MAKTVLQKYNMYLALTIHLTGFLAALVTGKHLYRYRLFPIIKSLLVTLTCTALFTNGVSIIGSILLINFGQSLSTCTLAIYNMSVAPLTSTVLMACLAIDRFYMAKKKVPNVRKIQSWNMLAIILTALFGHMPIVLSVLEKPIPFVAQCAGFEDDQPDNWYGLGVASIIFVSWVITACYTFKLKRIFKNSMKNRYSRKIPNNLMKIGYGYSLCLVLFVAAVASFPGHKALVNNLVDFISILPGPLVLRYAVKNQKKSEKSELRQLHEKPEVLTQKPTMNGDIRLSGLDKSQNYLPEAVTIINPSTVKYSKRSFIPEMKERRQCNNPDDIITETDHRNTKANCSSKASKK